MVKLSLEEAAAAERQSKGKEMAGEAVCVEELARALQLLLEEEVLRTKRQEEEAGGNRGGG